MALFRNLVGKTQVFPCFSIPGAAATKGLDGASGAAGLDTMAEDLDQLKCAGFGVGPWVFVGQNLLEEWNSGKKIG